MAFRRAIPSSALTACPMPAESVRASPVTVPAVFPYRALQCRSRSHHAQSCPPSTQLPSSKPMPIYLCLSLYSHTSGLSFLLSPLPLSALGGALQSRGPKSASLAKHPRMAVRQPARESSRVLQECRFPGAAVNLIKVLSSETGNLHFKQAP